MRYRGFSNDRNAPIWAIIIINLLVFIATLASSKLIFMLGLQPAAFLDRPWTIITNMFVHSGLWHIMANMLTLYFYGSFLMQLIGVRNFLLIYFCGGILGNIFFLFLAPPLVTGIGASGAVFALGGALAILTPKLRVYIFPIPVPMPLWIAVIGGFLILSLFPGIAWQAHLGGLVLGLIAGYFLRKRTPILF
ncbi:rhomboid family intramembrane serine protease [Chloroflexota bacterium]